MHNKLFRTILINFGYIFLLTTFIISQGNNRQKLQLSLIYIVLLLSTNIVLFEDTSEHDLFYPNDPYRLEVNLVKTILNKIHLDPCSVGTYKYI